MGSITQVETYRTYQNYNIKGIMAFILNQARQGIGNFVDALGTAFVKPVTGRDLGISEFIAGGPTTNTYGTRASTGVSITPTVNQNIAPIQGSGTTSNFASNPSNYLNSNSPLPPPVAPPTTNSSGGNKPNPYTTYINGTKLADLMGEGKYDEWGNLRQQQQSSLDAIRSRLDEVRRQAQTQLQRAGEDRDYVLNTLKSQAGQLRDRASQRLQNSLQTLDQEGTKLSNIYERSRGDQRRRTANAELQNRMRARALNRLDSSFYDDIQAENTGGLTRSLGVLDVEENDKQAGLGTRRTETNQYFNDILGDIDAQTAQAEREALRQYQAAQDQAQALERAGVADFGEGMAQADANFQSRLSAIQQAAQQAALQRMQLAASLAQAGGSVDSFNTIDQNLSGVLGDSSGLNAVAATNPTLMASSMQGATPSLTQLLALTRQRERSPWEAIA